MTAIIFQKFISPSPLLPLPCGERESDKSVPRSCEVKGEGASFSPSSCPSPHRVEGILLSSPLGGED